jgi:tetraacyldisaccharide 4'-kinase
MYATWYERVISGNRRGLVAALALGVFTLLSMVYLLLHGIRLLAYKLGLRRVRSLPRAVISVGNLTVGGTGKTPFVEKLSRLALEMKHKPVILSRGYGSKNGVASDEALLLKENLPNVPHYTGASRYEAGLNALNEVHPDVFLLDDGFQHWQLRRDMDIVLVDALNPFGYGRLTPRGMLREPLGALRRADVFVITRGDQVESRILEVLKESLAKFNSGAPVFVSRHRVSGIRNVRNQKEMQIASLKGRKVLGFCGIGNPRAFHGLLIHLGVQVAAFHAFRDHFRYTQELLELMVKEGMLLNCEFLATTQKDAVKLRDVKSDLPILEILIKAELTEGYEELKERMAVLLEKS